MRTLCVERHLRRAPAMPCQTVASRGRNSQSSIPKEWLCWLASRERMFILCVCLFWELISEACTRFVLPVRARPVRFTIRQDNSVDETMERQKRRNRMKNIGAPSLWLSLPLLAVEN